MFFTWPWQRGQWGPLAAASLGPSSVRERPWGLRWPWRSLWGYSWGLSALAGVWPGWGAAVLGCGPATLARAFHLGLGWSLTVETFWGAALGLHTQLCSGAPSTVPTCPKSPGESATGQLSSECGGWLQGADFSSA